MSTNTQKEIYTAPGKYSVKDAASILGVSTPRVIQMIYSGELKALRTVNEAYLVDARVLHEYQRIRAGNGRPWKETTAWAALWMLSGKEADWLDYHQSRRLIARLKSISAKELIWLTRKRASTETLRASSSFLDDIREELLLSGRSSDLLPDMGLTERRDVVEGYLDASNYQEFKESFRLVEDSEGSVIVRLFSRQPFDVSRIIQMPIAVVLTDLSSSTDTRERSIATAKLEELLYANR